MPLFYFKCGSCLAVERAILDSDKANDQRPCGKCGKDLHRTPKGPNASAVERLDNGFMVKAIERPADAERLFKERARKAVEDFKKNV